MLSTSEHSGMKTEPQNAALSTPAIKGSKTNPLWQTRFAAHPEINIFKKVCRTLGQWMKISSWAALSQSIPLFSGAPHIVPTHPSHTVVSIALKIELSAKSNVKPKSVGPPSQRQYRMLSNGCEKLCEESRRLSPTRMRIALTRQPPVWCRHTGRPFPRPWPCPESDSSAANFKGLI